MAVWSLCLGNEILFTIRVSALLAGSAGDCLVGVCRRVPLPLAPRPPYGPAPGFLSLVPDTGIMRPEFPVMSVASSRVAGRRLREIFHK